MTLAGKAARSKVPTIKAPRPRPYTADRGRADVLQVCVEGHWAVVSIYARGDLALLQIHSDLGGYTYQSDRLRKRQLSPFLARCEYDYVMSDLRASSDAGYQFDRAEAARLIRQEAASARRRRLLTVQEARDLWDAPESLPDGASAADYRLWAADQGIIGLLYENDAERLPMPERRTPECVRFWEYLWPAILMEMQKQFPEA